MDSKTLNYIDKKELIKPLLIHIPVTVLPAWLVEVIAKLADDYPDVTIYLFYKPLNITGKKSSKLLWPVTIIEKLVFRQKFRSFKPIDIHASLRLKKNIVFKASPDREIEKNAVNFYFGNCEYSAQEDCYILPHELIYHGNNGVIHFLKRFLLCKRPYQVISKGRVVWKHRFQTLEYSIDKNSGFFKAAVKQSFESIWCSTKKLESIEHVSYNSPGLLKTSLSWSKTALTRVIKRIKKVLFYKRWFVVITNEQNEFTKLVPKGKDGWADPFITDKHLFVEQINAGSGKGHLVAAKLNGGSTISEYSTIVKEDFHLSYPNIFQLDDSWYMIPESAADNSLRLYEATHFPDTWKFLKILQANARLLDFTPLYYNDMWWLFTISKRMDDGGSYDQLFLFYSNDFINDEWQAHPQNPIVTDSSVARPAGKLYFENGALYRPSQNCFEKYGGCIKINKVVKLSQTEYQEELVEEISPESLGVKAHAVHTLNKDSEHTVYDGQTWELKF
ncbi:glucosamine inositolphosphorylceramide transferase family protein [Carboxylicivirga sp. RSCT41]|uniref:glucosamine inositolphosphorylceramide transferase family protein n=1 Tax=Carboxylicivirga agarovorans TaxID=3417570 RepID=UPI003D332D4D